MAYDDYNFLKLEAKRGVLFVTIDHPPINLLTQEMAEEFLRLSLEAASDDKIKVILFDSANPDFFIAHYDVAFIAQFPTEPAPARSVHLHELNRACEGFRRMPKISIAKVEGRARGGGSEFLMALDMRFGAKGRAVIAQPELALGIMPGAGGTQRLPRLIGIGRALEMILGCGDLDAEMAERYGYFNRVLPSDELTPFVEDLSFRVASFTSESIASAKRAVLAAQELPLSEGLMEETRLFSQTLFTGKKKMRKFMESGGQTYDMELDWRPMVKLLAQDQ